MSTAGPAGFRRWASLGVLAAALSLVVLDGTIVAVALPRIIVALHLDLTDAQWISSLYSMVFAASLLTIGRLADRFGRRRVLALGLIVFTLSSLVAARADSGAALIAARAVQGIGGAMILPTTLATVNATFRGRDRAVAFGVWGSVMSGMAAVGPLLGGWLTSTFDWSWIFLVNLPLGAIVLVGVFIVVPETRSGSKRPGVDVDGLLTSAIGMALLVFGLIEGSALGWWRPIAQLRLGPITWPADAALSPAPVAIAAGLVMLVLFVLWERHRAHNGRDALLDIRLFEVPTFSWGNVTAFAVAAGEFALVFVLPLYLVISARLTVMEAGWVLAAMALGAFVSGSQARHLSARFGAPGVVVLGLVLELLGALGTAGLLAMAASPLAIAATMIVYGVGLGLASAQLTSTLLVGVPAASSGAASATQSTVRQVGSALGTAAAGSMLATQLGRSPDYPHAAAYAVLVGGVFLAAGLLGALRVRRVARSVLDPELSGASGQPGEPDALVAQ